MKWPLLFLLLFSSNIYSKTVSLEYRYLGSLMQGGVEFKLYRQFSLSLLYGRFQGKVDGSDELGFIPGLDQYAIVSNVYLGREKEVFTDGVVFRFGVHHNRQKSNDLVARIEVDGVPIIAPGESRTGTQIGLAYHWQWKHFFANVGSEYVTLGPYKSFVPVALTSGFVF